MIKPSLDQVSDYMVSRGFMDYEQAEMFYDHFESNGWMVGKNKMKKWEAAARNWIRNSKKWGTHNARKQNNTFVETQREQARTAMQALERRNGEASLSVVRSIR